MKRINVLSENISPNQRRLRLKELSGQVLTDKEKNRISELVSMINPSKYHNRMKPINSTLKSMEVDDEFELGDSTEDDIREYVRGLLRKKFEEEMEDDEFEMELNDMIEELEDEMMMDEILEEMGYEFDQKNSEIIRSIYLYIVMKKKKNYYIKKEKSSSTKWIQKSGQSVDDITFSDGIREIGFEEWLQEEFKH